MPADADHGFGFRSHFLTKFERICGEFQLEGGFSPLEIHSSVVLAWLQRSASVQSARQQKGECGVRYGRCGSQTGDQDQFNLRAARHDDVGPVQHANARAADQLSMG